jgi:poly-gamma-glutamate synthesis protein (capsule biosynthesis protein)
MLRSFWISASVLAACQAGTDLRDSPDLGGEDSPDPIVDDPEPPAFASSVSSLPEDLREAMSGTTWSHECPVHLTELRLLTLNHWDFSGEVQTGKLVLAESAVETVDQVFRVAFESKFPFARVEPASTYGGSDEASMAANNTSAFNCRSVTGGSSWSQHSYGNAVDINPIQNPYVKGSTTLPPEGEAYRLRDPNVPGLLVDDSLVVQAFKSAGWGWGGDWSSLKDYQHFSENGN